MQPRLLLLAAFAVILAAAGWFALSGGASTSVQPIDSTLQPGAAPAPDSGDELADLTGDSGAASSVREEGTFEAAAVESVEEDHPWAGMLAGLTGRL
ncbi:MAG: hypothetical protein ACJA2W_003219, partial [Planctomycetota bacterium]